MYSGFKNGENENDLDSLPFIYCAANIDSPAGIYDIIPYGGSDKNYEFFLVNGQLQIFDITGINNIENGEMNIYPNPTKNELFIKTDLIINKVEVYSSTSALLLSDNNFNGKISVSSLLKGIYLVKVYTDNGIIVNKIVKE